MRPDRRTLLGGGRDLAPQSPFLALEAALRGPSPAQKAPKGP